MKFSTEDTSSSFQSNLTKIETYQTDIGTFETSITADLTSAQGFIDTIDLGDWSDKVETKFSSFIDNSLKKGVTAMTDDISGGSFNTLKTTVDSLHTSVQTCYNKKKQIETKTLQLDRIPEYVDVQIPNPTPSYMTDLSSTDDDYITKKEKNPTYTQIETEIETLKGELETAVGEANGYISTLEGLTFDASDTSGESGGNGDKSGDKSGDKGGDKSGDKGGGTDSSKQDNGLPKTDGNAEYQAYTDIYPGDNMYFGGHITVDPNTGNWIIQDTAHNATLYVPNSDGTITEVYLGSVSGEDAHYIFNTVNSKGVDGFVSDVSSGNKDPYSSMYLMGNAEMAVSTTEGTVTYSSKEGEDGHYLPHIEYKDPDNYENPLHPACETNRMTDAYMNGSGQQLEGGVPTYED